MTVLDAPAVLALVHDEPGAELVGGELAVPSAPLPVDVRCPDSAQHPPEDLTADRAWVDLDLPIRVRLLR